MTSLTQDTTITVGTTGDYQNVNDALVYFSGFYPIYKKGGIKAEIKLLSGFVMTEQIIISGIDLSWITITSENEISVNPTNFTTNFYGGYPMFGVDKGGKFPYISAHFNYVGTSSVNNKHGLVVVGAGSSANISGSIKNAHGHAIFAYECGVINGSNAILDYAKDNGAYALRCGIIDLGDASLQYSANYGIYGIGASIVNAGRANASYAGQVGIYASESSHINAADSIEDTCGLAGLYAVFNSSINAYVTKTRNQANQTPGAANIRCDGGSFVNATSLISTGSTVPQSSITPNILTSGGIVSM